MPVNLVSSTKFTTPATASEPQAAEAPPVTTSTRETSELGRTLMSVMPVMVDGVTRRPLSSTSVRLEPRLRKLRKLPPPSAEPKLPRGERGLSLPDKAGNWFTKSEMVVGAARAISAAVMTLTGVGASKPDVCNRVPVTTIPWSAAFGWSPAASGVCSTGSAPTGAAAWSANAGADKSETAITLATLT
jgi:hypothetical protein